MRTALIVGGLYLAAGVLTARKVCPMSFPFGHNARMVTVLWPVLYAAQAVKNRTGKYPKWTPFI